MVADLVDLVGLVAVGVVAELGDGLVGLGELGHGQVLAPLQRGGQRGAGIQRALQAGDLASAGVDVPGHAGERLGHRGGQVGVVVGEGRLAAGAVGGGAQLPLVLAAGDVGERGLAAARVGDAVELDRLGVQVGGRPGAVRGGVGEAPAPVGQEAAVCVA